MISSSDKIKNEVVRNAFGDLLSFHLRRGTRPPSKKQGTWKNLEFGETIGASGAAVGQWCLGRYLPQNIDKILDTLFGDDPTADSEQYAEWRRQLREAWDGCQLDRHSGVDGGANSIEQEERSPRIVRSALRLPTYFVGREREILDMENILSGEENNAVALFGMPGVGKSVLAAAYIEKHGLKFNVVWWIDARSREAIEQSILELGKQVEFDNANYGSLNNVQSVIDKLNATRDGVLLIFDGADLASSIWDYIPKTGKAKFIITSKVDDWRDIAMTMRVEPMTDDIGAEYLVRKTGRVNEYSDALELSRQIGGHPLALTQAASRCIHLNAGFNEYRKLDIKSIYTSLGSNRYADKIYSLHNHSDKREYATVVAVLHASIWALISSNPEVVGALYYLSVVPSSPLPESVFLRILSSSRGGIFKLHRGFDPAEIVGFLVKSAILERFKFEVTGSDSEANYIYLHPLLREATIQILESMYKSGGYISNLIARASGVIRLKAWVYRDGDFLEFWVRGICSRTLILIYSSISGMVVSRRSAQCDIIEFLYSYFSSYSDDWIGAGRDIGSSLLLLTEALASQSEGADDFVRLKASVLATYAAEYARLIYGNRRIVARYHGIAETLYPELFSHGQQREVVRWGENWGDYGSLDSFYFMEQEYKRVKGYIKRGKNRVLNLDENGFDWNINRANKMSVTDNISHKEKELVDLYTDKGKDYKEEDIEKLTSDIGEKLSRREKEAPRRWAYARYDAANSLKFALIFMASELEGRGIDAAIMGHILRKKALSEHHPLVGESYYILGVITYVLGCVKMSIDNFTRSLDIRLKVLYPDNEDVVTTKLCLILCYITKGELGSARNLCDDLRAGCVGSSVGLQLHIAANIKYIGLEYFQIEMFDEASECFAASAEILKEIARIKGYNIFEPVCRGDVYSPLRNIIERNMANATLADVISEFERVEALLSGNTLDRMHTFHHNSINRLSEMEERIRPRRRI